MCSQVNIRLQRLLGYTTADYFSIVMEVPGIEVAHIELNSVKDFKAVSLYGAFHTQDDSALAIGRHLRALTHLELIGNIMTNHGLQYILRSCCHLESLDMRRCRNMWGLREDLGKKCSQQIKNVKFPCDDLKGHPYARDVLYEPEYESDYLPWEVYDPYDHLYDDDYTLTTNNNDNFDDLDAVEP
ncbi:putative F-box/LRR-repeat protein 22 [Bidens hawaiensis]|uniref:putative F-box/LRR-repeat protein 22 n=1 Tax=Bidens hawaiensis TaxID=980011 RepID=UPI00404A40CB